MVFMQSAPEFEAKYKAETKSHHTVQENLFLICFKFFYILVDFSFEKLQVVLVRIVHVCH